MAENVTKLHMPEKPAGPQDAAQDVQQVVTKENKPVADFKPQPVTLTLGDTEYTIVYDLNAYCEMETMYDSVDSVIQMLMGAPAPDLSKVTYNGAAVNPGEIMVGDVPLTKYISDASKHTKAKYKDTLNLLWLGVLHDYTEFDADGEVAGYTISKAKLGSMITLANMREVNAKIMTAILRDLLPAIVNAENTVKNAVAQQDPSKTE